MRVKSRRKSIAFFITLGACLVALAATLNVGWILLNWRQVALLVFGIVFFIVLIIGLVLNTTFLVREIRRNEQHDSFINAVTHELKTPITSIRLYLETLQTREVEEERRREFYKIMLADTDRLLHTVEQVLHAGQSGQRHRRLQPVLVDISDMARACLESARTSYHLDDSALRFSTSLKEGEHLNVLGDADELRAAVSNIIDNAVKYSGKNVDISVVVEAVNAKRVMVRISDSGVGIPRGHLRRIFKRFYRAPARSTRRIKGTGLGLFIVRSVVEKHGGRVYAESEGEGLGSAFTILLPRANSQ